MDKESDSEMFSGHKNSIDSYGFTNDFFNELPLTVDDPAIFDLYMEYYRSGNAKTYSEKYADQLAILEMSDQAIVAKIDEMMEEMIEAAKRDDADRVKELVLAIKALRT